MDTLATAWLQYLSGGLTGIAVIPTDDCPLRLLVYIFHTKFIILQNESYHSTISVIS
jgi:hypothetical protein